MPSISPNNGSSRRTVLLCRREEVSSEIRTMGDFKLKSGGPLSPEVRDLAEKELRETPENVKKAVEELRELLKKDDSMYFSDHEELLLVFLRPCHFYAESAYKLMKRVAEFKETHKNVLENLMPEDEIEAFTKSCVVNVLRDRDSKGRRVLIVNVGGAWDPSKVSSDQLFRLFYLIHIAAIVEEETQVRGVVVIMDFENLSMKQVMALSISFSQRLLTFIQHAMPIRLKEVHIVKQPFLFNMIWAIFKTFVEQKLKGRMYFHGSKMSSLHKHLAASHLPKNYGGQLPEINYSGADWYPVIDSHIDMFEKWNTYGLVKKQ